MEQLVSSAQALGPAQGLLIASLLVAVVALYRDARRDREEYLLTLKEITLALTKLEEKVDHQGAAITQLAASIVELWRGVRP